MRASRYSPRVWAPRHPGIPRFPRDPRESWILGIPRDPQGPQWPTGIPKDHQGSPGIPGEPQGSAGTSPGTTPATPRGPAGPHGVGGLGWSAGPQGTPRDLEPPGSEIPWAEPFGRAPWCLPLTFVVAEVCVTLVVAAKVHVIQNPKFTFNSQNMDTHQNSKFKVLEFSYTPVN